MGKNITKLKKDRSYSNSEKKGKRGASEPRSEIIDRILQFAATYRSRQVDKGLQVDVFLN